MHTQRAKSSADDATAGNVRLLLTVCLTAALIPLSIASPAMSVPAIRADLGGSASALNWINNAYLLTYGSTTMVAGSLADIYGRKRVWLFGLLLFALATALIPWSPSVAWLDVLRLTQGLGAAAGFAGAVASLTQVFHGMARVRVFSLIGMTFGAGGAFGPLFGGVLVEVLNWHWVFWIPALLAVLAALMTKVYARESRDPAPRGLDWPGAVSFTLALALLTYAVILAPERSWLNPWVVGSIAAALALWAIFVLVELRAADPMLDLRLFRNARFVGVQCLALAPAYSYVVLLFLLPARMIGVEGQGALDAGLRMIALSLPLLVVPMIASALARRFTVGMLCGVGLLIAAVGLYWLSRVIAFEHAGTVAPMLLIGIGVGLPWGLMDGMAVSVVPKEQAGMATGIFNAVRLVGDGLAYAVATAILTAFVRTALLSATQAPMPEDALTEISIRTATGDLQHAASLLVHAPDGFLRATYDDAFQKLLIFLSVLSALTAGVMFTLLSSQHAHHVEESRA